MPLRLPDKLPAIELLKHENIFVMDESRAHSQEIRPLRIVVLNLMPLKITTETDLVRLLSNTPLQIEVYFMKLKSHTPKNTPIEHMMMFYKDFAELSKQKFDGTHRNHAVRGRGILARDSADLRLGSYTCHLHTLHLLGRAGRTLPFLWRTQASTQQEDVWHLPTEIPRPLAAYLPWLRRLVRHAAEPPYRGATRGHREGAGA